MTISPLALQAKKVIEAAWLHGPAFDLASQAAFALESAQLLQSPETAAEGELSAHAVQLAEESVAELRLEHDENARLRARVAELERELAAKGRPAGADPIALTDKSAAVTPRVRGLRELVAGQRAALEDPHDSPLHRKYLVSHDLPEMGGSR